MSSSAAVLFPSLLALALAPACDRTPEAKANATPPPPTAASVARAEKPAEAPKASSYQLAGSARVVAIGDIHGDLNALRHALKLAGAIDSDDRWIGGKELTVVQTGDLLDRGDQDREVLDVIEKLENDAKAAGSAFIVLNGNHELMNSSFDFRYVTHKSFSSFDEYRGQAGAFEGRMPDEQRGRAAALMPGGPYALKLAPHLTVARVGDSLFAHGGVLPAHIEYGLDRLNSEASAFLSGKLRALPPALSAEDSPVWTRAYGAPEVDDATCEILGRVLKEVGAKRLIVGHTVQKGGITSSCQERVFRIDVGLSAYYGDNPAQVLEITPKGTRVLSVSTPGSTGKTSQSAGPALHSSP
ncbi:MAG TPA: metallophosphoesterase [Polyangiaceae bacterium]|nr:metallophosphoesterase [Polyangiaceae bacterium]